MARRRIGETMAIADQETMDYVLDALNDRVLGAASTLVILARKDEGETAGLVDHARRLVGAYDAWQQAGGGA